MKHLKLFEEWKDALVTTLNYIPMGILRTDNGIELHDVSGVKDPSELEVFDWIEYVFSNKKPLFFGKHKFENDMEELTEICGNLKIESVEPDGEKYTVIITGNDEDLDQAFDLIKIISDNEY